MDKSIEFTKWLELNTDLSEKSIKNYSGAIKKISNDLINSHQLRSSVFEINNANELETLKSKYFNILENKHLDERGKGMYSAAFNKLIDFKKKQGSNPVSNEGIVYILTNPAMPGLVKIGKTNNLEDRMKRLFNTGVPLPFRCISAKKVKNYSFVENKLKNGLKSVRENMNREFFRIAEDEVIHLLEMIDGVDVTPKLDNFEDKEDELAFENATRVRQKFNFDMVGIKIGSILNFVRDENITCKVISKNKVEFQGKEHSLSSAGLVATNNMGFKWKSISGPLTWKFDGELLDKLRQKY